MPGSSELAQVDLSNLYYIIGTLVVMNLGTIITIIVALVKFAFNLGKFTAKFDKLKEDVDALHRDKRESNGKR